MQEKDAGVLINNEKVVLTVENERLKMEKKETDLEVSKLTKELENISKLVFEKKDLFDQVKGLQKELNDYSAVVR